MPINININNTVSGEILNGIAKAFDVSITENGNEHCIDIPENLGKGYFKNITFGNGVSALVAKTRLKRDLKLHYPEGLIHPLKILVVESGHVEHQFSNNDTLNRIEKQQSAILASTPQQKHIFSLPARTNNCFISIQINRKEFEHKIEGFLLDMHTDISQLFRDLNGIKPFYYKNFYSLQTSGLVNDFFNNDYHDMIGAVYQEGKTYEIMAAQLRQYLVDRTNVEDQTLFKAVTRQKIWKAVDFIINNLEEFEDAQDLADRVRLNYKTLQKGFKELYSVTVNQYVQNQRIEKAKSLLKTTDLQITEIAYKVGLSSSSYLAKLFKTNVGMSPKHYRKRNQ